MRISNEWLGGLLWILVFWKTDNLGYDILIDTNKELRKKHCEKRDQSWSGGIYMHFL